jgi:hypothetical protein
MRMAIGEGRDFYERLERDEWDVYGVVAKYWMKG